jgi:hypothetical protein
MQQSPTAWQMRASWQAYELDTATDNTLVCCLIVVVVLVVVVARGTCYVWGLLRLCISLILISCSIVVPVSSQS